MGGTQGVFSSVVAFDRDQPGGNGIRRARPNEPAGTSPGGRTFAEGERRADGREQLSQIQRGRILAAMIDVASRDGVGNATVARVVARSGMSRRTFYEQFLDREDCFLVAFAQALDRIAEVVGPAYSHPPKWPERVRFGFAALLQFLDREPVLARFVIVEGFGAGPKVLERRRQFIARAVAIVDREGRAAKAGEGPPPLTGEGVIGGVLSLIHSRLAFPAAAMRTAGARRQSPSGEARRDEVPAALTELLNPLVSLVVSPYLGPAAARRELERPLPDALGAAADSGSAGVARPGGPGSGDPLRELDMRLTYRTVRVLLAIGELAQSGGQPSNREVGDAAGIRDQGQVSKLLARLRQLGLVENAVEPRVKGEANGWTLTPRGQQVRASVSV